MRFFTGARGADMRAKGRGIGALTAGEADSPLAGGPLAGRLAIEAPSPTWLAAHPRGRVIYAALEGSGRVAAYRRTGADGLAPLGDPVAAGADVCHLAVAPDGSRLVASCWGDGALVHVGLRADGSLGEATHAPAAADPYTPGGLAPDWAGVVADDAAAEAERAAEEITADGAGTETETPSGLLLPGEGDVAGLLAPDAGPASPLDVLRALAEQQGEEAPGGVAAERDPAPASPERTSRAHAAAFLPDGRVATTDLGFDLVRFWRVGASGLVLDHEIPLPFGVGPRHLFVHPSGHLHVVTEFSCEVWTLRQAPGGRWAVVSAVPTGAVAGDTGAELAPSRDRAFLYAGLRGSDTIAVLRVAGEGERLQPVALVEAGVRTPRHHVVVRDTLLVAGQGSDEIVSLPVDERTGVPGRVRRRFETPCPQHLLSVGG